MNYLVDIGDQLIDFLHCPYLLLACGAARSVHTPIMNILADYILKEKCGELGCLFDTLWLRRYTLLEDQEEITASRLMQDRQNDFGCSIVFFVIVLEVARRESQYVLCFILTHGSHI